MMIIFVMMLYYFFRNVDNNERPMTFIMIYRNVEAVEVKNVSVCRSDLDMT